MAKRRRSDSLAATGSKGDDEGPGDKKKRKLSAVDPAEICSELYETIRNYRDENGRVICESLIRVPKRRSSPDYYEVVDSPIDLLRIQQKLKTEEYEDVDTLTKDMHLLFDNAMKYYQPDSQEYKDAVLLKEIYEEEKSILCEGENEEYEEVESFPGEKGVAKRAGLGDEPGGETEPGKFSPKTEARGRKSETKPTLIQQTSRDDDDAASTSTMNEEEGSESGTGNYSAYYEELVTVVLELRDPHGRIICELFKKLPPENLYPEYYAIIKEPIDLRAICSKIKSLSYSSLDEVEKDLMLLVKNAHTFNEPGSQIYKDATAIKKAVHGKRAEIEHTLMGAKSSRRLKARRYTNNVSDAISALLDDTDDQMDESYSQPEEEYSFEEGTQGVDDEGAGDEDVDNPLMMLFNEVYNYKDPTGRSVSEPFLRLPSRRAYPDYYEVISKPVALLKIRSQIKAGQYGSLDAVEQDLELCFRNAQTYNEPSSMLYKDAERLQELMRKKKKEVAKYVVEKGIVLEEAQKLKKKKMKLDSGETPSEDGSVVSDTVIKKKATAVKEKPKKKKGEDVSPAVLKKRMQQLYKAVQGYQDENGRYLSAIFTELPSAEEYPDYYKVITEPVCLSQIEGNIRDNKYNSEEELLLDFEVMFENAKYYNEEDSQVHQDALTLEKVLKKKKKALGPIHPTVPSVAESANVTPQHTQVKHATPTKSGRISSSPAAARKYSQVPSTGSELKDLCKELFAAVKDCTDSSGRQLCIIFQKLPSRSEYPDYYTLIKKPIDMAKIASKLNADQYQSLDEFMSDFCLMFDNACRYNDPDSQVYKDALTLQRELIRKKVDLIGDEHTCAPNVQELVQKLFRTLNDSVMHHIDEEGRCFSDSLVEIKIGCGKGKPCMTLASIGENLRKGYYKRMDRLQDDVFAVFEKARRISRSDCETYDDASELQLYWVLQRDKLCKDGERFVSPAILVTKRHLQQELDEERKKKNEAETKEDERRREEDKKSAYLDVNGSGENQVQELEHGGIQVRVGDFVYVHPREEKLQPHIVLVEKLWIDRTGEKCLYGTWFYRPEETFHLATRKFLKKEVFRSDFCDSSKLSQVQGKCYVMFVKEYFRLKPEEFGEQDVYVCESRYNVRPKAFKKIKVWSVPAGDVTLTPRSVTLVPERVPSVFTGRTQAPSAAATSLDIEDERPPDNKKNVVLDNPINPEEGCTYYEQFCLRDETYKLGESVYVRSEENYVYISRIDKIWTDRHGATWFHGPWFVGPGDTQHLPSRMFYDKEYFLSSTEETSPIGLITAKCCVLPMREYCRCRPTEIHEKDIYVNEARYDDEEMQFRKLKGLKRYTLTVNVLEDEYYFFEDVITPVKAPSPLLMDETIGREERSISPAALPTESDSKRKRPKPQSGYLLFSNERRAVVRKQHPEYAFGEISRLVGVEWRSLTAHQKAEYEARAQMQPSHHEADNTDSSHGLGTILHVYDCMWQGCDYQYEDMQDLTVHMMDNATHLTKAADGFYHCFWTTCTREKRGIKPFNSSFKLFRHCREVHLKGTPRVMHQHERSKNFFPRHQAALQEPDPSPTSPKATPQPPTQGPQTMGHSAGSFVGIGHGTSQALGSGYPQGANPPTNALANQNTSYLGGRLTPQSMQQGIFQGAGFSSSSPGISQNTSHMLQRQMPVGASAVNIHGVPNMTTAQQQQQAQPQQQQQPAMTGQQQPFQQAFNQTQTQFNMQQQMAQLQMQAQQLQAQQQQQQQQQQLQQQQQQPQQQLPAQSLPQTPVQTQPQVHPQAPAKTEAPARPVFVAPPPRPQRLHHSEAYLRYIEGLRDGTPHMSNWSQARKPDARAMTPQQMAQLPVHWLGGGYGDYDNAVDALWALRDHLLKDALSLSKLTS